MTRNLRSDERTDVETIYYMSPFEFVGGDNNGVWRDTYSKRFITLFIDT